MALDRKRVLVINHFASPGGQPGGTRHVELFSKLHGWDHLIVAADRNYLTGEAVQPELGFETVKVMALQPDGWRRVLNWLIFSLRVIPKSLTVGRVDVVYASSPHLLAGLSGWMIGILKRAHFVLEVRDLWPRVLVDMGQIGEQSGTYRALVRLESFLYSRARRIVILAEGSRDHLLERGVAPEKITYIPNGSDAELFVSSASREELRRRLGFNRFTAVYAGAHGPANGLALLLHAAANIEHLPIDIVLIGDGVQKRWLVAEAEKKELSNVRFLAPIAKQQIPDLLTAADLGIHTLADVQIFRTAVSPNKVFDYMAAGLPVLTNCPGEISRIVAKIGCGVSVAPHELARGLEIAYRFSRSRAEFDEMGARGRDWLCVNQSRSMLAAKLLGVLDDVDQL